MTPRFLALLSAVCLATSACDQMTPQQSTAAGAIGGGAAGLLLADAFDANDNWKVIATLAGAAAGTMVAQNSQTQDCAYARGDGTYYTAPCP